MKVIHKMLATLLTFCLTVSSVPMAQAEDMKAEVPLELKSTNVKESAEESNGAVDEKIEIQIDSENLNGQSYMQASTGQMELEPSSQKIFSSASQLQLVNYIYMSSVYSGCFGNQLSGLELELYNLYVYLYAEQKSTNSYTHTLEDPIYFTPEIIDNVLIDNESLEMALTTVSEALQTAQDAFAFDYPEVFWFSTTRAEICYIFSYSEGMITSVTLYSPVEIYSGASSNITSYENAVAKATAVIKSRVGNTSKRYYAVKAIHDYVCNNAYYGSTSQARAYSSDGFFLGDGGIVCQGYAYTIKVLCDQLNIPCVCVGGYGSTNGSTASHMWNYIQMEDGKWYMLDATWDDQSSDTDINYTYFLAGSATVGFSGYTAGEEHIEVHKFAGCSTFDFAFPALSITAYDSPEEKYVVEAALYKRDRDTSSIVETLNYAVGSFSYYDNMSNIDISNWEKSVVDVLYGAVSLSCDEEMLENITLKITLPDGLSFSEISVEREKEIEAGDLYRGLEKQVWFDAPIYLLYSEQYDSFDTMTLQCELSGDNMIEDDEEIVDLAKLNIISKTDQIMMVKEDSNGSFYYTSYSWNADMFTGSSTSYNSELAEFSAYMSELIEGSNKSNLKMRLKLTLLNLGFSNIQYSGTSSATIIDGKEEEYVCAIKKIVDDDGNVQTIVLYAIQGSDTMADWLGNLSYSGLNSYHDNFSLCADNNIASLSDYLGAQEIALNNSSVRMLITGHSRGGAIANLIAYRLLNNALSSSTYRNNIYCYTFAAPNVETIDTPRAYSCIYNIVNYSDIVPFVPGGGLTKYGITKVFNTDDKNAEAAIVYLRMLSLKKVLSSPFWGVVNFGSGAFDVLRYNLIENHQMAYYISAVQNDSFDEKTYSEICNNFDQDQNIIESVESILDIVKTAVNLIDKVALVTDASLIYNINCPVDVDVLDSSGNVVCRIENDEIALYTADDIGIIVIEDTKEIWFEKDSNYRVEISGYDDGEMDCTVISINDDAEEDAVYILQNIPVIKGETVITAELASDGESVVFCDGTGKAIEPDLTMNDDEITMITVELLQGRDDVITSGAGTYATGSYIWIMASCESDDATFVGWYDMDGNLLSDSLLYGFSVYENITLTAVFSSSVTCGDLNGDGEVNASDLTILARHVGKVETMDDETYLANADVTGDGSVDASDLTKLAQYVGKIISSLD